MLACGGAAARPAPDLPPVEFKPVPVGTNSAGDCLRRGRAKPLADADSFGRQQLQVIPWAVRPAPDLPPGKAHSRPPKVRRGLVNYSGLLSLKLEELGAFK